MRGWKNIWDRGVPGRSTSTGSQGSVSGGGTDAAGEDRPPSPPSDFGSPGSSGAFTLNHRDVKAERSIAFSARNLGDGVQAIVLAAKARASDSSWKADLVALLQGPDLALLLEHAQHDKFVLRCVENELPPNLIHCLRLLRVLELQNAAALATAEEQDSMVLETVQEEDGEEDDKDEPDNNAGAGTAAENAGNGTSSKSTPQRAKTTALILDSVNATQQVSKLLCQLCTDPIVGDQLRPHLFGLLALSGASYPPTALHVAQAASDVILALAEHGLTRPLVRYIHDRKMVVHMTDDVKELCNLAPPAASASPGTAAGTSPPTSPTASSTVPNGLAGLGAEAAGLWSIAMTTLVKFIAFSCRFSTVDLVKDFEGASGYKILRFAIQHSTKTHGKKLIELLPVLACCPLEVMDDYYNQHHGNTEDDLALATKLATNSHVFDIMEDLVCKTNPFLRAYRRAHNNEIPDPTRSAHNLTLLAQFSLQTAMTFRLAMTGDKAQETWQAEGLKFDMSSDLLDATLQLFSDHPDNYETLEGRQHALTYYILALPCYRDEDIKIFVLKTLEFVLTGVGVGEQVTPVNTVVEVFFALCHALMQGEDALHLPAGASPDQKAHLMELLAGDMDLMGSTLEKLLQFDQRVAPLMVESGLLTTNLSELLNLVSAYTAKYHPNLASGDNAQIPPASTPLDHTFVVVCGVLKLLVAHQPVNFSKDSEASLEEEESTNLHTLLRRATNELGTAALSAAAGVYEAYLSSFASLIGLKRDMDFVFRMLTTLKEMCLQGKSGVDVSILRRQTIFVVMLRGVLEARSLARDAFRDCAGFQALLLLLVPLQGKVGRDENEALTDAVTKLIQAILGVLDAAIGSKSRNPVASSGSSPLIMPADVVVDPVSSQLSMPSPACANSNYLRRNSFYLDLAAAIHGTGIMLAESSARNTMLLAFTHVDAVAASLENAGNIKSVRNPDALRLVMGLATFLALDEVNLTTAETAMDEILKLCDEDRATSTLPQLATCGLCWSLTNPCEFASALFDKSNHLQDRFMRMLVRLASYNLSYMDIVSLLRCVAGPILACDDSSGRVRLPVISSAVSRALMARNQEVGTKAWKDDEFLERLAVLCDIAGGNEGTPGMRLGGDSVNTIAVLMHAVKLDDRLRAASDEGRLKFLEVDCLDTNWKRESATAASTSGGPPSSGADKIWSPLLSTGFTFSVWLKFGPDGGSAGNIHILDISSPSLSAASSQAPAFLSLWYDVQRQRFNVVSSASYRAEPTCFPVSPLLPGVWHNILATYTPAKRSVIARKSILALFVDGRPLEAEVKVDSVSLPPDSRLVVGSPNPAIAVSGIVRGFLPLWELGPTFLLSTILLELDAAAVYAYGPGFTTLLWGDRPQRLSLSATATSLFSMLSECGEAGSIASALRRRELPKLEGVGYTTSSDLDNDQLSAHNIFCKIPPECVVFSYHAGTLKCRLRSDSSKTAQKAPTVRLVNLARLNFDSDLHSGDALVYGRESTLLLDSFAESVRWAGGPFLLLPLVERCETKRTLAQALRLLRLSVGRHQPSIESMQAEGGYRVLAVLLQEKSQIDELALNECLAFAISLFSPTFPTTRLNDDSCDGWVLSDLDAAKHLLLNHQVWDLKKCGPAIPLRLLGALNRLVDQQSYHKAFNARRLHLIEIVRWALHMMIESAELYTAGEYAARQTSGESPSTQWYSPAPSAIEVSVGGDPGNLFLQECKNLLRRVLTFMLTPGDLEALAEAIVHTINLRGPMGGQNRSKAANAFSGESDDDERMLPGPTMRLYLVRLLEELIVDGVNEIVASSPAPNSRKDNNSSHAVFQPHTASVTSPNQPYLATASSRGRLPDGSQHTKHHQAQAFLSAFAGFLTPIWFATVLEGCREEASASALLRLMILMLQSSHAFESAFQAAGSFAPFVLSIPKFSTSPGILISLLSQMLNAPILHLHSLPTLDPEQLCEVFDAECHSNEDILHHDATDPSSGVFALLAECLGRNVKLVSRNDHPLRQRARETNAAVFQLLSHRHDVSAKFQEYSYRPAFLEPLSQALCLVYEQHSRPSRLKRRSLLVDVPKDLSPTERFVGGPVDAEAGGVRMIQLLRKVLVRTVSAGPRAASVVASLFRSFPIHATPQQVEAFHGVLVEHCCSVISESLRKADAISIANCIGMSSVFLNQQLSGFLNSESILLSLKTCALVVNELIVGEKLKALPNAEHSLLTLDAVHLTRLGCAVALRASRPSRPHDRGDEDLQAEVLSVMDSNVDSFLLLPARDRKSPRRNPSGTLPKPAPNARLFPLWQSTNVGRCASNVKTLYPDLKDCDDPEFAIIAPTMVSLHSLLVDGREDVRSLAISVLVAFLQHRQPIMSKILVADVRVGDKVETVDVVNRGGFRALLAAHEAATIADSSGAGSSVKRKYASFFDWFDKHQDQVQVVFDSVKSEAMKFFPTIDQATISQQEAVEMEQQAMLERLTTQGNSDRTILGGLERSELAKRCFENTFESHIRWKRHGFDDLAFGAMTWKFALRRMKGRYSVWEGGYKAAGPHEPMSARGRIAALASQPRDRQVDVGALASRWKLDLTEGAESQRRRMLPNYEFHGLYNIDEAAEVGGLADELLAEALHENREPSNPDFLAGAQEMEATAALLKDLNLKRAHRADADDDDGEDGDEFTVATTASNNTAPEYGNNEDASSAAPPGEANADETGADATSTTDEKLSEDSSSYELIVGLLQAGDRPERSYNIRRCTGLEVTQALLLWCREAIYIIDGFEQTGGDGMDGKINRVEREHSSFNISLRPKGFVQSGEKTDEMVGTAPEKSSLSKSRRESSQARDIAGDDAGNEIIYQHRSQRIAFTELYSVYRRRYQLQQNALEFYDCDKRSTLVAFDTHKAREEVLSKVLHCRLPNSMFSSSLGSFTSYTKLMLNLRSKIVVQWVQGKMTNFDFLMHLNSFAGRSFNDLTQYPVFPWVIADYESEELNLDDPSIYRDLSLPMGAIGPERAQQFKDRYEALESTYLGDDDPPPFHYGTHYSCAAYVLYYLMRLEPFSRLALALQGGKFDVADRLFHDVSRSWRSASSENLQDVRELIPEFYYLPDFLVNSNNFDFGETQKGKTVHDVTLPKWAKGDPRRFIRINRQALESNYVSTHLHHWIDLVFGYKQQGREAVESLNTFVHVTYEGEVDIDAMTDPIQRASTIAQIQNFGQTPSRLERRPFPQRLLSKPVKDGSIDFAALSSISALTPSFCIVGAAHRVQLRSILTDTCKLGLGVGRDSASVGDLWFEKGQLIGVGRSCALVTQSKKYVRVGGINKGASIHAAAVTTRYREVNKILTLHDGLHNLPIQTAALSVDGKWLATGSLDSTVRVWKYNGEALQLSATLCGHDGWPLTCLDVCTEFGVLASGCGHGRVILWDLRTMTFVRDLPTGSAGERCVSVSVNRSNGNVLTVVGSQVAVFDINGNRLASLEDESLDIVTCAISTDCPEWMENGIAAITGHLSGYVKLWSIDYDHCRLVFRHTISESVHSNTITCLRATGVERQDTLLIGDAAGKISVCKTVNLDSFAPDELQAVVAEMQSKDATAHRS